jgi:hypothetical protein
MHQYMSTGQFGTVPPPTYDLPSYPHQAGYGAETSLGYSNAAPTNFLTQGHMTFPPNPHSAMSMPHTPLVAPSPWLHESAQTPVLASPAMEQQFFGGASDRLPTTTHEPAHALKAEDTIQSPTLAESPSDGKSEEAETLSPSSYFWQEMVLPGCDDATGTCQCGDGCECVGCLTHGGHNGVPLNGSASQDVEAFPDFSTPVNATGNDANNFLGFSDTPA